MRKKISVVIPTYNEEANVVPLSQAIIEVMEKDLSEYDYEILFIDNHSKDNTKALLRGLCANNRKIKAIFNAKKFRTGEITGVWDETGIWRLCGTYVCRFSGSGRHDPQICPGVGKGNKDCNWSEECK